MHTRSIRPPGPKARIFKHNRLVIFHILIAFHATVDYETFSEVWTKRTSYAATKLGPYYVGF